MFLYKYSQNNLHNKKLIRKLLAKTSISFDDTVIDIGAGKGIITDVLIEKAKNVIAIEIDKELAFMLRSKYLHNNNIEVVNEDFFGYSLPESRYKIFANIPFTFTADIVRKLFWDKNPAEEICITLQKEAADKLLGITKPSLVSILIKARYDSSITHYLKRTDFTPIPKISVVFVRFLKPLKPKIMSKDIKGFEAFVKFGYTRFSQNLRKGLRTVLTENEIKLISKMCNICLDRCCTDFTFEEWVKIFKCIQSPMFHMKPWRI